MMKLPSEDGRKDDPTVIAIARANIGYYLGDYSWETEASWNTALEGAIGPMIGPFASAAFTEGVTVIPFEDHEDLVVKLRLRGGMRSWIQGAEGV